MDCQVAKLLSILLCDSVQVPTPHQIYDGLINEPDGLRVFFGSAVAAAGTEMQLVSMLSPPPESFEPSVEGSNPDEEALSSLPLEGS